VTIRHGLVFSLRAAENTVLLFHQSMPRIRPVISGEISTADSIVWVPILNGT